MRNAFSGYSYQKQVTFLLLTLMDVERSISTIKIETSTTDNFDDLIITTRNECFQFQIKDFKDVTIGDLIIEESKIMIKGKPHKLSFNHNVLFFNNISIEPNEKTMIFPSYRLDKNISIISLTNSQIDKEINKLFKNNLQRKNQLESYFSSILDNKIWEIDRESLPQLKIFITELQEESVSISHKLLGFESILLIEGKPGIGKSHFVNTLIKKYKNNILYRFWIGNQDQDYGERLKFGNFIRDINIQLFNDQKDRPYDVLFKKLHEGKKTMIIDGLDHIENYNKSEFDSFVDFISNASSFCKIIVLSRPLMKELNWKKHILENWNLKQTEKVLNFLFHLSNGDVIDEIFKISQGYPIIVKYIAEHYKLHKRIPKVDQVENIDSYYEGIVRNEKGKKTLSLFLCTNSYIMESEIELLIGDEKCYVDEYIKEHPYLFDIKLNRISLFHDSFNTFLRKSIDFTSKLKIVNQIVCNSILNLEKRFLSRFGFFHLLVEQKKEILLRYASIEVFNLIVVNAIDYEAIRLFYNQLRETIKEINETEINVNQYYDLSLIFNLIQREHVSTINTFYYTYVESLILNGIKDEDVTSSDYLFGMYYYIKTNNAILLFNRTANDYYSTDRFYEELEYDIYKEQTHIEKHVSPLTKKWIDKVLKDRTNFSEYLTYIIENIYIHKSKIKDYQILESCIQEYINGNMDKAIYMLGRFSAKYKVPEYYSRIILEKAYNNLLSYGFRIDKGKNDYHDLSLKELICKFSNLGSFDLRDKIHNYIRFAFLKKKNIDIGNIYLYWTKYYQRKDYTLSSLPIALKTLQCENRISLKDSVNLIKKLQDVSEKGYRHILADFIELYSPAKIISFLEKNFDVNELNVRWFELPTKYIDRISESTYRIEEHRLISYHSNFLIPMEEIENVLHSNKFKKLEFSLAFFNMKVSFKEGQKKTVLKFEQSKLIFEEFVERDDYKIKPQSSHERLENGIFTFEDLKFIQARRLEPSEIAEYSDGYYTSLPNIKVFEHYTYEQINHDFQKILYNSLISKTKSNYFYFLWYHPGNILTMMKKYRSEQEFEIAIKSFEMFMKLSMFTL